MLPSSFDPALVWGIFTRIYGALFAFALLQLYPQIRAMAGEKGLYPIKTRLDRIRSDYPVQPIRYFLYPTLHWFGCSDIALERWLLFGGGVGGALVISGLASRTGLAIMWLTYLSQSCMMNLMYPWDVLLMESAFLSLWLPSLSPTSLAMPVSPAPLLAFMFRWLVLRLMIGFGKFKFIGASTKEFSYLRGFMINQPMPSVFGRLMYHLPLPVHVLSLVAFFVSEMIVPFFFLASGSWRVAAAAATIGLMLLINLVGNFGFFNLLAAVLCIPMLDANNVVFGGAESLWSMATAHGVGALSMHVVLLFLFLLSLVFLPFNSWCTMSFFLWPAISLPVNPLGTLLRYITNWHLVHAYGVFFPHSSAGARWIPIIEGTDDPRVNELIDKRVARGGAGLPAPPSAEEQANAKADGSEEGDADGIVWRAYEYKFMTARTDRMPPFCAPWHQRLDQAILYESIGMTPETFLCTLSSGNRYEYNPALGTSMLSRLCACILQDNRDVEHMFRHVPFPLPKSTASGNANGHGKNAGGGRVQALRVSFHVFTPTSLREILWPAPGQQRQWWRKNYVGLHVPVITRRMVERSCASMEAHGCAPDNHGWFQLREPELAHPEHYITACDAPAVQRMLCGLARLAKQARHEGKDRVDSLELLSDDRLTPQDDRNITTINRHQVAQELWGPDGFVAALQPLLKQVVRPVSSDGLPQLDFEQHLAAGQWSRAVTAFLRAHPPAVECASSPRARARLEKILARAALALTHALVPHFHGPAADEMTTMAQIAEALGPSGKGKLGKYCLRACARDKCADETHFHLPSFLHLYLFAWHVMLVGGRDVYEQALMDPVRAARPLLASFSLASGMLVFGVLHPYLLAHHAAKIRMIIRISFPYQLEHSSILPGFLSVYYNFLSREFRTTEPEEGAFSETQHLPKVRAPARYDEAWVVDDSGMPVRDAPGLVVQDANPDVNGSAQVAAAEDTDLRRRKIM